MLIFSTRLHNLSESLSAGEARACPAQDHAGRAGPDGGPCPVPGGEGREEEERRSQHKDGRHCHGRQAAWKLNRLLFIGCFFNPRSNLHQRYWATSDLGLNLPV